MTDPTIADPPAHTAQSEHGTRPWLRRRARVLLMTLFGALAIGGCAGIFTPSFCLSSPTNCSRIAYQQYLEPFLEGETTSEFDLDVVRRPVPASPRQATAVPDLPFYGMQYVPEEDLDEVASLGINAVLQDFPRDDPDSWIPMLDAAHERDMRVVAWQWPSGWTWDEGTEEWLITPEGRLFIETVADHPALLAVYGVHEPYWNECFGCGWESKDLRQLYQKIKRVRNVPVYAAFDGFDFWREFSPETTFGPGICDICDTWYYPARDDDFDRDEYVDRLVTELALFRKLAPDSQFVWVVQSFSSERSGRKMPTAVQMREMIDLALWADVDGIWWYTWDFDATQYEQVLSQRPDLHRVVRESYDDFLDLMCPTQTRTSRTTSECSR